MFHASSMTNEQSDTDGTGYLLTEDVLFPCDSSFHHPESGLIII